MTKSPPVSGKPDEALALPQVWQRTLLGFIVAVLVSLTGWGVADRTGVETRLVVQERALSDLRLSTERAVSEARLTSSVAVSEVRITSQTTNAQMIDILRRLDRMESKIDALR